MAHNTDVLIMPVVLSVLATGPPAHFDACQALVREPHDVGYGPAASLQFIIIMVIIIENSFFMLAMQTYTSDQLSHQAVQSLPEYN